MVAAILAGGASRRMGGEPKAWLELGGQTLLERAVAIAVAAGLHPVVVAKAATALPETGAERWEEPEEPQHPLTGLHAALARCGPEGCVATACDTPFVPAALLRALAGCPRRTFVRAGGRLHPLPGRWFGPVPAGGSLLGLRAAELAWPDGAALLNLNSPRDLAAAERQLRLGGEAG